MDVREQLVELLAVHCDMKDKRCIGCEKGLQEAIECKNGRFGKIADHLIAHGVTVQEWISVTERLPEESGMYIVAANDGHAQRVSFVLWQKRNKAWNLTGARSYWRVTHWRPMPQPPKGE